MVGPYGLEHRCNSADYPTLSLRSAAQEGIHGCLKFLERLVWPRRRLQSSAAVNQKNRRVTRDVAVEAGHFTTERQQRVAHRDLL